MGSGCEGCNQEEAFPSFVPCSGSDPISNPTPRHHQGAITQQKLGKLKSLRKPRLIELRDARCMSSLLYKYWWSHVSVRGVIVFY